MKKLGILTLLALELAVCGCASNTLNNFATNTASTAEWEAQLVGGTGPASELDFLTTFNVQTYNNITVPLDIPAAGFNFFNSGQCFSTGFQVVTVTGTAAFATTQGTDQVIGQLSMTRDLASAAGQCPYADRSPRWPYRHVEWNDDHNRHAEQWRCRRDLAIDWRRR